ncbi:DUF1028 domain-containing protein (plasmid) [Paroceanicella profunda]|uniref:DUF1028 domain-containing protein n=1 Tax=Paroceanicella profunda TaxID=2579971 RepID=A0A5B8FIK9_9RHOB|nr:DUF1028 domain-containing protein [Paroceanicella profunda]QDL93921.1 DUF1028 domain-containing protein [Paroceanicella profunda]
MTFSLAGVCARTGQIGYAVTTSSVCVGARVGAIGPECVVFSQARTDPRLHAVGLAAHAATGSAEAAIGAMRGAAVAPHWRQFGILTRSGAALHHTGASCLPECGGLAGAMCLALGNFLGSAEVMPAMVATFEATQGPLAERLIAGLAAGVAAGAERDPLQSAALKVLGSEGIFEADLRADRSPTPVDELARLWADWAPKAAAYRLRVLDPDSAPPSREVEHGGRG